MIDFNHLIELKPFLDDRAACYDCPEFIDSDPIQIPHQFSRKEDIEIAAFLTATISWGQRKSIIHNANRLMELMDHDPFDFLCNGDKSDRKRFAHFVHRTFNGEDCIFFLDSLRNIYLNEGGLEGVFSEGYASAGSVFGALQFFRGRFLSIPHEQHVRKHIADVSANASAKRLNMFLRWMVRPDVHEVDFGLWKKIPVASLMLPLDVHSGDVARAYGLLSRKQNDWKAVEEITAVLRKFDVSDPVKYDFALFGFGLYELNAKLCDCEIKIVS
jgi:uncharacterized protein (TIGR02757 family)